jgi:hypothetical protein
LLISSRASLWITISLSCPLSWDRHNLLKYCKFTHFIPYYTLNSSHDNELRKTKWLKSNIFRADNSCLHLTTNGLLICSVVFPYCLSLSPCFVPLGCRPRSHTIHKQSASSPSLHSSRSMLVSRQTTINSNKHPSAVPLQRIIVSLCLSFHHEFRPGWPVC